MMKWWKQASHFAALPCLRNCFGEKNWIERLKIKSVFVPVSNFHAKIYILKQLY